MSPCEEWSGFTRIRMYSQSSQYVFAIPADQSLAAGRSIPRTSRPVYKSTMVEAPGTAHSHADTT
jgi:hypothetical protein